MKKILYLSLIIVGIIIIGAGAYAFMEYNRKPKDAAKVKAAFSLNCEQLCQAFLKNEKKAQQLYDGKAIAVTGELSSVEKDEHGSYTLIFEDSVDNAAVRCSLDSLHNEGCAALTKGRQLTVKGFCSGFNKDDLLGSDVLLSRCTVEQK